MLCILMTFSCNACVGKLIWFNADLQIIRLVFVQIALKNKYHLSGLNCFNRISFVGAYIFYLYMKSPERCAHLLLLNLF